MCWIIIHQKHNRWYFYRACLYNASIWASASSTYLRKRLTGKVWCLDKFRLRSPSFLSLCSFPWHLPEYRFLHTTKSEMSLKFERGKHYVITTSLCLFELQSFWFEINLKVQMSRLDQKVEQVLAETLVVFHRTWGTDHKVKWCPRTLYGHNIAISFFHSSSFIL